MTVKEIYNEYISLHDSAKGLREDIIQSAEDIVEDNINNSKTKFKVFFDDNTLIIRFDTKKINFGTLERIRKEINLNGCLKIMTFGFCLLFNT